MGNAVKIVLQKTWFLLLHSSTITIQRFHVISNHELSEINENVLEYELLK